MCTWKEKIQAVYEQQRVLWLQRRLDTPIGQTTVPCICGVKVNIMDMYQCLYCREWFCRDCAEEHFGQTIKEYRKKNPINTDGTLLPHEVKAFTYFTAQAAHQPPRHLRQENYNDHATSRHLQGSQVPIDVGRRDQVRPPRQTRLLRWLKRILGRRKQG